MANSKSELSSPGTTTLDSSWRRCVSFPVFLGVLLFAVLAFIIFGNSLRMEGDTWWHITLGQGILSTHTWPTTETFSFSARGTPWFDYEWLGDVFLAIALQVGGLHGLELLFTILSGAIVVLSYVYATLRCGNSKAAFVASLLLLPITSICFTVRPQLFGYIFLLVTLILLEQFRRGRDWVVWFFPPLFLLWINTHGSFPLGFAAIGVYWLCSFFSFSSEGIRSERCPAAKRHKLELASLLSVLVLPLTPYGIRLAIFPFQVASALPVNMAFIREWKPTDFGLWEAKLLLILLAAFLVAEVALRIEFRLEDFLLFAGATYLMFVHYRFIILFGLLFAPFLAKVLSRWIPRYEPSKDQYLLNALLIPAILAGIFFHIPTEPELRRLVSEDYPVRAAAYLHDHPNSGPMFNAYADGGYLEWSLGHSHQIFIDGRGDLFEKAGVFADYMHIINIEPDALALLQKYGIQSCLIHPNMPLGTLLAAMPGWKKVYADDVDVLYIRDAGSAATSVPPSSANLSWDLNASHVVPVSSACPRNR